MTTARPFHGGFPTPEEWPPRCRVIALVPYYANLKRTGVVVERDGVDYFTRHPHAGHRVKHQLPTIAP